MELFMKGAGLDNPDKVMVYKYGQMEPGMKDSGEITRLMAKESLSMWMEMCMMETGMMIRLRVQVLTTIIMGQSILVNG